MAKILIVLPFSGAQFTGGLAVVNEQLAKALAESHDVKLLTFELNKDAMATQEGHGKARLLVIRSDETSRMVDPGGKDGGADRNRLYALINSQDVLLGTQVTELLGDWTPDYILGHSRFSGPAAILLKKEKFKDAKVGYFLHSYPPVEGVLLRGYEAFEEPVNAESSMKKLAQELQYISEADVVLAMGPLMRWGATLMLEKSKGASSRVHEVISGVSPGEASPAPSCDKGVTLILSGRASAAVKGFQDIVLAALQLRNSQRSEAPKAGKLRFPLHIKVRGMNDALYPAREELLSEHHEQRLVTSDTVNAWTRGVFGEPIDGDMVDIEVLKMVRQDQIVKEYASAHGVITAAYLEHFGLVPFEALGCGRPVLISELSGSGQFLRSRFGERGQHCVVEDFASATYPRPLTNAVLKGVAADAFDRRVDAWELALFDLVNHIEERLKAAVVLKEALERDYTLAGFAQSVVRAFDPEWSEKITRQVAGGGVEEVPSSER